MTVPGDGIINAGDMETAVRQNNEINVLFPKEFYLFLISKMLFQYHAF